MYEWVSETRDNTLHILSIDEDPHANDSDPEEEQQQQVTTKRVVLHQDSSAAASTDIPTTSTSSSSSSNNIFEDIDEIENNNNTQQDHEVSNTITDTSSSQYRLRLVAPAAESTSVQKDPLIVDDFDETEAELELDMQDIMDKVKRQIIKKHPGKIEERDEGGGIHSNIYL